MCELGAKQIARSARIAKIDDFESEGLLWLSFPDFQGMFGTNFSGSRGIFGQASSESPALGYGARRIGCESCC